MVTPRRVKGTSAGELLDGETIEDLITVKTDLQVNFVSTEEGDTSAIAYICNGEYVKLKFSDPITATDLEGIYIPTINGIEMAIDKGEGYSDKRYYYGFSVSFKER
nr:MAG TPA: hypothetical protein [Caudoviricetes sp.]